MCFSQSTLRDRKVMCMLDLNSLISAVFVCVNLSYSQLATKLSTMGMQTAIGVKFIMMSSLTLMFVLFFKA